MLELRYFQKWIANRLAFIAIADFETQPEEVLSFILIEGRTIADTRKREFLLRNAVEVCENNIKQFAPNLIEDIETYFSRNNTQAA